MIKRVTVDELTWLVTDAFNQMYPRAQSRISVAIVPDKSRGWRAIVPHRTRRYIDQAVGSELAKIEKQLRQKYRLAD